MKESFYKTFEEKMVALVTDRFYNDEIGGRENHYYDTNEMLPIEEEDLIALIAREILVCKTVLWTERGYGLEAKHIRFIGKKRIEEIVRHRVQYRHTKEGKLGFGNRSNAKKGAKAPLFKNSYNTLKGGLDMNDKDLIVCPKCGKVIGKYIADGGMNSPIGYHYKVEARNI